MDEPRWSDDRIKQENPRYADKTKLMRRIRDDERKLLLSHIDVLEQMVSDLQGKTSILAAKMSTNEVDYLRRLLHEKIEEIRYAAIVYLKDRPEETELCEKILAKLGEARNE